MSSSNHSIAPTTKFKDFNVEIARAWREFLKPNDKSNIPQHINPPSWADAETLKSVEDKVKEACAQMEEGGALHGLGLSEGEVAAVLLCTSENSGPFQAMQEALFSRIVKEKKKEDEAKNGKEKVKDVLEGDAMKYGSLAAALVSALRKLRAHQSDVGFVYVSEKPSLFRWGTHGVAYPFLRGTTMVPVGGYISGQVLLPYRMHAAVIPECLCLTPEKGNVLFEPGTTFVENESDEVFEQANPLVEEEHLLFPPHAYFPPLIRDSRRS